MSGDESGSGSSALKIVLIVLAVVFGLGILCSGAVIVLILVPRLGGPLPRTECANNLRQLGALWTTQSLDDPGGIHEYDGPAALLQLRARGLVAAGSENLFICPNDPVVSFPLTEEQLAEYARIDLADPPDWLTSYAVRVFSEFPLDENAGPQAIAACRHHRGGLNVLFDDGSVKFKSELDLAIDNEDADLFGEESSHPLLRPLRALGD